MIQSNTTIAFPQIGWFLLPETNFVNKLATVVFVDFDLLADGATKITRNRKIKYLPFCPRKAGKDALPRDIFHEHDLDTYSSYQTLIKLQRQGRGGIRDKVLLLFTIG